MQLIRAMHVMLRRFHALIAYLPRGREFGLILGCFHRYPDRCGGVKLVSIGILSTPLNVKQWGTGWIGKDLNYEAFFEQVFGSGYRRGGRRDGGAARGGTERTGQARPRRSWRAG